MDYLTFHEWAQLGRAVRKGQHAEFYRVNPETKQGFAVFTREQTEELGPPPTEDGRDWELVPAAEYKANRQPASGPPRVLVDRLPDGTFTFWVGTSSKLNKAFKQGRYQWDPRAWRWRSHKDVVWPPEQIIKQLEASGGYTVVREFDAPAPAEPAL